MRCHCEQTNDHLMSAWQSTDISNDKTDFHDTQNEVVSRNDGKLNTLQPKITGTCHSENVENQNVNSVDFQVVQNLKEEKNKKSQQSCCPPELVSASFDYYLNQTLKQVQGDSPLGALHSNVINKNDVSTYFDKIDFDKLPNSL